MIPVARVEQLAGGVDLALSGQHVHEPMARVEYLVGGTDPSLGGLHGRHWLMPLDSPYQSASRS